MAKDRKPLPIEPTWRSVTFRVRDEKFLHHERRIDLLTDRDLSIVARRVLGEITRRRAAA